MTNEQRAHDFACACLANSKLTKIRHKNLETAPDSMDAITSDALEEYIKLYEEALESFDRIFD